MRSLFILMVAVALSACESKSRPEQTLPAWVMSPPQGTYSECSRVFDGDMLSAKKVAIAKAKSGFLHSKRSDIESKAEVSSLSRSTGQVEEIISSQTTLKAEGYVTGEFEVLDTHIQDKRVCVLMGA